MKEEYVSDRCELEKSLKGLDEKLSSKVISQEEYDSLRGRILRLIELIEVKLKKEEPKSPEDERRELYKNGFVKSLLSKALEQNGKLEPEYKVGEGFVYSIDGQLKAEELVNSPFIQRMIELNILEKELYKRQPTCPRCGSASLIFQIACPKCHSQHLEVKNMIEHYRCGYIATESEFLKGTELICPKCNRKLNLIGKDYRRMGVRMRCGECGELFSLPHQYLSCMNCGESVDIGEEGNIRWQTLYIYKINQALLSEIRSFIISVTPIVKILEKKGWTVKTPGKTKGVSGILHDFSIIANKNNRIIALDLAEQMSKIGSPRIIAFFAKQIDVKPDESIFIAIPGLEEDALQLANYYNINVVEGKTLEEAASKFESKISL